MTGTEAVFMILLPQLAGTLVALLGMALYFRRQGRKRYVCQRCRRTPMTGPGTCRRCSNG